MTYKFPQFNVEISNPTIFVNLNTIQDKAIDQLLSVDVVLTTDTAKFGVTATDMPYSITWEDSEVEGMVNNWLIQFEV
jgi:endonuclease/exonuclease/phosphatase (EEP) superfamily protein YafD